jgi:hypothetical protein
MVPLSAEAGLLSVKFEITNDDPLITIISHGHIQFNDNIGFGEWHEINSMQGLASNMDFLWFDHTWMPIGGFTQNDGGSWSGDIRIKDIGNHSYNVDFSAHAFFLYDGPNVFANVNTFEKLVFSLNGNGTGNAQVIDENQNGTRSNENIELSYTTSVWFDSPVSTPIPAAAWLLGSGLVGLVGARRKLQQ